MSVVLVTGGSSGIGRATVQLLAAHGHQVFAASRRPTRKDLPEGVTPVELDVADGHGPKRVVETVVSAAGRVDAVVNNAGTGMIGPAIEMSDDDARYIFEVNFFGPMRLAREAVEVMRSAGGGRIVNVTSMNDTLPAPFAAWYSASKAALAAASVVLDAEVHRFGVSVSVVAPGFFRTEMAEGLSATEVPPGSSYAAAMSALAVQNSERLETAGDPSEVAEAIARCIEAEEAPARVVVGADAKAMVEMVADTPSEDLARLLRKFVRDLG